MTVYAKTRRKYGLTARQMAKYCNLPLSVYYKIENGKELEGSEKMFEKYIRNLAIKKVEELGEEQATELKIEEVNENNSIEDFIENFNKDEYFKKFNIGSYEHLKRVSNTDYTAVTIQKYMSRLTRKEHVTNDFKRYLYEFFTDTNNVQEKPLVLATPKLTKNYALTEDQEWYEKNLKKQIRNKIANKFGNGKLMGSQRRLYEQYPEISSSELSRVINGGIPSKKTATLLRNIFEEDINIKEVDDIKPKEEGIVDIKPKEEKVDNTEVDKGIEALSIINEKIENKINCLTKENEILKELINQLPSDTLLNLFISSKIGK